MKLSEELIKKVEEITMTDYGFEDGVTENGDILVEDLVLEAFFFVVFIESSRSSLVSVSISPVESSTYSVVTVILCTLIIVILVNYFNNFIKIIIYF